MTPAEEWTRCKPWIEAALADNDLYDMAHIERQLALGEYRLWTGRDCVALTEFISYPKTTVINVFAVAGKRGAAMAELFLEIEPIIIAWAKELGCTKIMGSGIKESWRPVCEEHGYQHQWTVMAKDI